MQSKLWGRLHNRNFEEQPAAQDLDLPTALRMLDYNVYFDLIEIPQSSSGSISRLIKEAVGANLIKPLDPTTSNEYMKYVPFWA